MTPPIVELKPFQLEPTTRLTDCLLKAIDKQNPRGQLVIGPTGSGKTFVMAFALARVQAKGFYLRKDDDFLKLHTVFILVPKNSVIQTTRVFNKVGVRDTLIINADNLRTQKGGELYIDWVSEYQNGILTQKPVWKADTMPSVIIADECQMFKNPRSQRTKVLKAFVAQGGLLILVSATPFQKASEAELIVEACRYLGEHNTFSWYADQVSNSNPSGNSPIAIKRIKNDLEANGCLNSITGVKYPFKPKIANMLLDPDDNERARIEAAYELYAKKRREILKKPDHQGIIELWQAQRVMRAECELVRVPKICRFAKATQESGRAILFASNYIPTIRAYWTELVKKLGVGEKKISFLVGGLSDKKRQENIDNFQTGKTDYFLTTLKSGGVSLSLNHQFTSALPRTVVLPPTWSIYELMQMLGRGQRIDNLSAVEQYLVWYKGTIEEKVANRLGAKYDCVKELLDRKDDYISNLFNSELGGDDTDLDEQIRKLEEQAQVKESGETDEEETDHDENEQLKSLFDTIEI
jgi:superfamily II DNA or RNA helicase